MKIDINTNRQKYKQTKIQTDKKFKQTNRKSDKQTQQTTNKKKTFFEALKRSSEKKDFEGGGVRALFVGPQENNFCGCP